LFKKGARSFKSIGYKALHRTPLIEHQNKDTNRAMKGNSFFNITTTDAVSEIRLYGSIGGYFRDGITSKAFADEFKKVDVAGKEVHLRINSPGGEIYDGIAIFNTIQQSKANVSIYIDGIAASMASVIALAGKRLYMSRLSRFMTHKATGGVSGDAEDMKNYASQLEQLETIMATIYAQKTGLTIEQAKEKYLKKGLDRWISAQEALDEKIIDGIYDLNKAAPPANEFAPMNLWNFYNEQLLNNDTIMKEELITLLGCNANASDTAIIQAVKALVEVKSNMTTNVTAMIALAKQRGKIDKEKEDLYTMVAKDNPQFVMDKLFEEGLKLQTPVLNLQKLIEQGNAEEQQAHGNKKPKNQWTLDDYRKFAPAELTNELYNTLIKKEGLNE